MPRIARILPEQGVFHIITRGNNKQRVFMDVDDFKKYLYLLKLFREEHGFKLYHYCLMSNHVHLILETTERTKLPKLMKQINLTYMHHYRKKYKYFGHFWQDRYKSLLIDKDSYLLMCGKYIELNPVRAKMVGVPEDYAWSSYKFYISQQSDDLLTRDPVFEGLSTTSSARIKCYRDLICEGIDLSKRYLGSEHFVRKMETTFGVSNIGRKRGRPGKAPGK